VTTGRQVEKGMGPGQGKEKRMVCGHVAKLDHVRLRNSCQNPGHLQHITATRIRQQPSRRFQDHFTAVN